MDGGRPARDRGFALIAGRDLQAAAAMCACPCDVPTGVQCACSATLSCTTANSCIVAPTSSNSGSVTPSEIVPVCCQ